MPGTLISLAKSGKEKGAYPVNSLHAFIGSHPSSVLRIQHEEVSPKHCVITAPKDKPASIKNLSRTLPTLLNGKEIGLKYVQLTDNDIITIKNYTFKWKYDTSSKYSDSAKKNIKGRKSWPLNQSISDEVKPKIKRKTIATGITSSKKEKVIGLKSGVKRLETSFASNKSVKRLSPAAGRSSIASQPSSTRKSVKFFDSLFQRKLGRRHNLSYAPPTPYRPGITPGKGKMSLYFTPPSTFGKPTKGILKTPGSASISSTKLAPSLADLSKTPPGLPEIIVTMETSTTGLKTPPRQESPEVVMRSSRRRTGVIGRKPSPDGTPKSTSKKRIATDQSLEASERAAKKLKADPPRAIDKKKMAALLQCHRKSLTPHPAVQRRGRLLPLPSPGPVTIQSSPQHPPAKVPLPTTPTSTKRPSVKSRVSGPTPYSNVVPRSLLFGSLSNTGPVAKKKRKKPFRPINLERKYPFGRSPVAKMSVSPQPPQRKMTRASRAERASKESAVAPRRDATDVLSALDLSRKNPPAPKPTSPIPDFANASGIKELFSEKAVDVRELFGAGDEVSEADTSASVNNSLRQSKRISQKGTTESSTSNISVKSFNIEGAEELPVTSFSLNASQALSTSRRSLSLKSSKTSSLRSSTLIPDVELSTSPSGLGSSLKTSLEPENLSSDFSLGSFNSSYYKSVNSSHLLTPTPDNGAKSASFRRSITQRLLKTISPKKHQMSPSIHKRLSLRRVALNTHTKQMLKAHLSIVESPHVIGLTQDNSNEFTPSSRGARKSGSDSFRSLPSSGITSSLSESLNTADGSQMSQISMNVHVDDLESAPGLDRTQVNCTPDQIKLSKSVSLRHSSPKALPSLSYSAPGKIDKSLKKKIKKSSGETPVKHTRSSSSINIDLFKLDEIPTDVPSSTPFKSKTKGTRTKGSSFELENLTNSFGVGSVESRLLETSNIVQESSRGYLNEIKNESERKDQSLRLKSTRNSSVNINLDEKKHNRSSLKKTPSRSLSHINESPHNLEASMKQRNNTSQVSESNICFTKSRPSKTSEKSSEEQRSFASPSFLESKRSSRSRSSINLNLFDLDKKPDIKNISKPSNSSFKSAKASILSPLSANEQGEQDISLGASERRSLSGRSSLEAKSTKSKSSVNNNLFGLDERPGSRQSARTPLKNESFSGLSTESVSKSSKKVSLVSAKSCESIFSPSTSFSNKRDSSLIHGSRINLSRKSNRSLLNESVSNPDDINENTGSPKIKTPKRIVNQIVSSQNSNVSIENKENTPGKSSLRVSQASLKNDRSSSISSLTPSKKSSTGKIQSELQSAHGNRSTRSNSSVSINLFKLDETEKTPIERRQGKHVMLQTSVGNEKKLVSKAHASTQMNPQTPRVISVRSTETQTSVQRSHGIRKSYILYKVPIVNSSIPVCECDHQIHCVKGRRLLTEKETAEPGPKTPKIQESLSWSSDDRLHSESKSGKKSLESIHSEDDETSIAEGSPSRKRTSLQKGKVVALRLSKGNKKVVSSAIVKSVQHLPSSNGSFRKVDSSTENESLDRSVKGKLATHALKSSSSKKVISSKIVKKAGRPLGAVGGRKSAEESSGESVNSSPRATRGKKTVKERSLAIPKPSPVSKRGRTAGPKPPVEDTQPSPKPKRGRKAAAKEPSPVSKRGGKAGPKPPVEDTKHSPKPKRGRKAAVNEPSLAIPKPSPVSKKGGKAGPNPPVEDNNPSSKPKRGRKAAANEPPLAILEPSPVSKRGRKASPKPPVEDNHPSPKPKRGRKAAANEPPLAILEPSPVSKRGRKASPKPPVEDNHPSPKPKRGRKAAANEPPLAILEPSPVSKRGRKASPKPPVEDNHPSPKPKRGRKAAANEPPLAILEPSPVSKRGRKASPKPPVEDNHPSPKPKRGRKAAANEPSPAIPKPSPVSKRGKKADPKPPVEDTQPSPKSKRGRKAAAKEPSPVSKRGGKADPKPPVEDTKPSPKPKRGRKAAANEPSLVIPKPSPLSKRGRKADPKPPVEDTKPSPKPKRGNQAASKEPLVEKTKSSPVSQRGRKGEVELKAVKSGMKAADKQSVAKPGKSVSFEKSPGGVKPSTVYGKQPVAVSTVAKPGKRPSTESPLANTKPPLAKRVRAAASPQNNKATGKIPLGKSQGKSVTVPTKAPIKQVDSLNENNNNTKMPGKGRAIEPSGPSPPARRTRGAGPPQKKKTSLQKETTGKPNLKTAMKATAKKQKNSLTKLTAASVKAIIKDSTTGKMIVGAKGGKKNK